MPEFGISLNAVSSNNYSESKDTNSTFNLQEELKKKNVFDVANGTPSANLQLSGASIW